MNDIRPTHSTQGSDDDRRCKPPEGLGPALRAARESAGLSQTGLADKVLIQRSHVSKLERGTRCPSRLLAERLIAVLDLGPDSEALLRSSAVDADLLPALANT